MDDADLLFVTTVIEHNFKNIDVVADDIDILVLLTALLPHKVYLLSYTWKGKHERNVFLQVVKIISIL